MLIIIQKKTQQDRWCFDQSIDIPEKRNYNEMIGFFFHLRKHFMTIKKMVKFFRSKITIGLLVMENLNEWSRN